jgi:hypothetical protein
VNETEQIMFTYFNNIPVVPTVTTGTIPSQSLGILGGRTDFDADTGWSGCLDAPCGVPAGGSVFIEHIAFSCITVALTFRPSF